jgi:uncharacterized protein YgbK (DUF1537 family)
VGSAGLAEELARLWRAGKPARKTAERQKIRVGTEKSGSRIMVVIGSAHPRSHEQARFLKKAFPGQCVDLNQRKPVLPLSSSSLFLIKAPRRRRSARKTLRTLTNQTRRWSQELGIRRFVVTGGETAYALCRSWGLRRWRVLRRIDRGVPLCVGVPTKAAGAKEEPRWLALKPGGFGKKEILVKCVRGLQKIPPSFSTASERV